MPTPPDLPLHPAAPPAFYGCTVVRAAFVLAIFGWGLGFYSPSIFLHAVVARTGWTLPLVSAAVTLHFLFGAGVVACMPGIHRRLGVASTTACGGGALALGVVGWAIAAHPWQLFLAALLSGGGWVTMGAAGINAIVSPWFVRARPTALAKAYNGASIGGVIFSPLWGLLIGHLGFPAAALLVAVSMLATTCALSFWVFSQSPEGRGEQADGAAPGVAVRSVTCEQARSLPGRRLWQHRGFLTLAAAMTLSLFAQTGLITHLYSLLATEWGSGRAGMVMALATACAVAGRTFVARTMPVHAERRLVAVASYGVQLAGSLLLLSASREQAGLVVMGIMLFGAGIGNATSLPPLIAQVEFVKDDVPRAVALMVALSQGLWAMAPASFAVLLASGGPDLHLGSGTDGYFGAVLALQLGAITCMLAGRRPWRAAPSGQQSNGR